MGESPFFSIYLRNTGLSLSETLPETSLVTGVDHNNAILRILRMRICRMRMQGMRMSPLLFSLFYFNFSGAYASQARECSVYTLHSAYVLLLD